MTNKQLLITFLESINNDFNPPLSEKIVFESYVNKICEHSILIMEKEDEVIKGLVVMYCNDEYSKRAYIPLCGVIQKYRGNKIAKSLMSRAINKAKQLNYRILGIHSNNPIAIRMYEQLGFKIIEGEERVYMELIIRN